MASPGALTSRMAGGHRKKQCDPFACPSVAARYAHRHRRRAYRVTARYLVSYQREELAIASACDEQDETDIHYYVDETYIDALHAGIHICAHFSTVIYIWGRSHHL